MTRHARPDETTDLDPRVPPVLPRIAVTVRAADDVEIRIDDELLASGPIDRASLGRVLTALVSERAVPCRVEITEADGRRFADIVTPVPRPSRFAPPAPEAPPPPPPTLHRVEGDGFVPGEDVGVAIMLRTSSADGTGHAGALLEDRELPEGHHGVLLFGFVSGTIHLEGMA